MEQRPVSTFFIFNTEEIALVEKIHEQLRSTGISAYWDNDPSAAQSERPSNGSNLEEAEVVCVLIGAAMLQAAENRLVSMAQKFRKPIIAALIGHAPQNIIEKAYDFLADQKVVDLRKADANGIRRLALEIREAAKPKPAQSGAPANDEEPAPSDTDGGTVAHSSPWLDRMINTLIDGNEEERDEILEEIQTKTSADRHLLASRLRSEIQGRFSVSHEGEFASAVRDPKKLPSIRSWMLSALVWADPDSPQSEELFLRHVNGSYEPDRNVRFWVLGGLYQRHSRLLQKAAEECSEDSTPEVRALSIAVRSPNTSGAADQLRSMLLSSEFEAAWSVLRVLRIVPIKELVPDVCEVSLNAPPGSNLSYDALYAVSNPQLAHEAAERLQNSPGVEETVRRVVTTASSANKNASRNFAVLLAAFEDADGVTEALESHLQDATTHSIAQSLIDFVNELRKREERDEIYIAGYSSDFIDDKTELDDSLGIEEDVKTLTAVMLAQDVQAPLAIGLFGDWGSGKSYFMQSMHAAVEDLKANGSPELFRRDVCQIRFNAWHYVDTNLWASLVSTILERLAAHVSPEETPEKKEAALLKELGTAKAIKEEAKAEQEGAQAVVTEMQGELQKLEIEREQKEIALTELRISDLAIIFREKPELKDELEKSLHDLGVPAAVDSVSDLSNVLVEANSLRSRGIAFALSMARGGNVLIILVALVLIFVLVPLFGDELLTRFKASETAAKIAELVGQVTVALGSITLVLRSVVSKLKGGLERVEAAKLEIDKRIAEKRQTPGPNEVKLREEIANLKAREVEASSHLEAAAAKVVALEEQIRAIDEGRSLARFLAERTNSEDYRKHLGLISTIRKDFDSLAKTLSMPGKTDKGERLAVDRIILYIDDLDRCPENKVMDVLQAVHLLLAYPLFVVVVGVDPRWLLHSLGRTYSAFRARSNAAGGVWRTTPQNYLEKIFQIQFNLNHMTGTGYGKLLDTLMGEAPPRRSTATNGSNGHQTFVGVIEGSGEPEIVASRDPETARGELGLQGSKPAEPTVETQHAPNESEEISTQSSNSKGNGKREQFTVRKEALIIQPWEREFAESLYPLIPTPRAAKRFSNIYRILKARVRREQLAKFEGTKEMPGYFQIPMLLLAMLIGSPDVSAKLFPIILEQSEHHMMLTTILDGLVVNGANPDIEILRSKILPVINNAAFPNSPWVYVDWIPRVARFSFDVGRAVQTA